MARKTKRAGVDFGLAGFSILDLPEPARSESTAELGLTAGGERDK